MASPQHRIYSGAWTRNTATPTRSNRDIQVKADAYTSSIHKNSVRKTTTSPSRKRSNSIGTNIDPRFTNNTFIRPASASGASKRSMGIVQRNHLYAANARLMEKNEMLRRELDKLQRRRDQREDQMRRDTYRFRGGVPTPEACATPTSKGSQPTATTSNNRRLTLDGASQGSLKTIEISSVSSSDFGAAKSSARGKPIHRPAGSGVQAVRAAGMGAGVNSRISFSSASTDYVEESKNADPDLSYQQDDGKLIRPEEEDIPKSPKGSRSETVKLNDASEDAADKSSHRQIWRPSSASSSRRPGSAKIQYGKVNLADRHETSERPVSSMRPSSAHPSSASSSTRMEARRVQYAGTKNSFSSGSSSSSSTSQRPKSAIYRPSTTPSSTQSATPSSTPQTSQQQEKERLQKLVSSADWSGIGKPDCYVFGKLLGQGSFGTVRLAHHKITGHKVAVKTYERAKFKDAAQVKRAKQEIALMAELNHVHICRLFEVFETSKRIHLVMEAASGGNLCTYVKSRKRLPETEAVRIFYHVTLALEYLHANDIVHRDIKLENVLFDSNRVIKLVDFGFSVKAGDRKLKVFCGTPSYMAPEIVRRKEYAGFPVDVWSLGVLLYAMLCGRFPFSAKTYPELYKKIARGVFQIPEHISPSVRDALRRMLCLNPALRITIPQLREHKVLQERADTFPRVPTPNECTHLISDEPRDDVSSPLIKQLVDFGFPKERLLRSILEKRRNHLTTTYYLLAMKAEKKRQLLAKQREVKSSQPDQSERNDQQ